MKVLEAAWNSSLGSAQPVGGSGPEAYKSGYSVDILSNKELLELRRNIESTLDVRGVAPQSTCAKLDIVSVASTCFNLLLFVQGHL